jgi:hypothetical protein
VRDALIEVLAHLGPGPAGPAPLFSNSADFLYPDLNNHNNDDDDDNDDDGPGGISPAASSLRSLFAHNPRDFFLPLSR